MLEILSVLLQPALPCRDGLSMAQAVFGTLPTDWPDHANSGDHGIVEHTGLAGSVSCAAGHRRTVRNCKEPLLTAPVAVDNGGVANVFSIQRPRQRSGVIQREVFATLSVAVLLVATCAGTATKEENCLVWTQTLCTRSVCALTTPTCCLQWQRSQWLCI